MASAGQAKKVTEKFLQELFRYLHKNFLLLTALSQRISSLLFCSKKMLQDCYSFVTKNFFVTFCSLSFLAIFWVEAHFAEMGAGQSRILHSVLVWPLGLGGGAVYSAKVMREVRGFLPASMDPENLLGLEPEEKAKLQTEREMQQSCTRRFLGLEPGEA